MNVLRELKDDGCAKVKLAVVDIDGVLRGKMVSLDKFLSAAKGGFGFCDVVFGWDIADMCYEGIDFSGPHTGYPDARALVDPDTYRKIPWQENIPFFLADFGDIPVCPRSALKKVIRRAEKMGFEAVFSQEYEWFNFAETSADLHDTGFKNPEPMSRGMFGYSMLRAGQHHRFFQDIFDLCLAFKIPLEGIHTETGPGVYEAAITCSDVLQAADRAVLFKAAVKEIGHLHGVTPSFMAKWNPALPGCSGHLHQSLWRDGKNAFYDERDEHNMSELMKSYLAGVLHCLPHVLPLYAPLVNSYKRLVEGMWAPTTLTWGVENRTTSLRIIPAGPKGTRLENRVTGADMNPYLAMAASLASGLYGVEHGLKLEIARTTGNGYDDRANGMLPGNLLAAVEQMEASEVAAELFERDFISHFCATRRWEWRQYSRAVTDWELGRYFELA